MFITRGMYESVLNPNEANHFVKHIALPDRDLNILVHLKSFSVDESDVANFQTREFNFQITKKKGANPVIAGSGGFNLNGVVASGAADLVPDGSGLKIEITNPIAQNVAASIVWDLYSSSKVIYT